MLLFLVLFRSKMLDAFFHFFSDMLVNFNPNYIDFGVVKFLINQHLFCVIFMSMLI